MGSSEYQIFSYLCKRTKTRKELKTENYYEKMDSNDGSACLGG